MSVQTTRRFYKPVPDELMIPLGIRMSVELRSCADNWTDSEVMLYRVQLPTEYHAVPPDALRRQFTNLRKKGSLGSHAGGVQPGKGSKKPHREKSPQWYLDYLKSEYWTNRKAEWLEYWKTCCICNGEYRLDVHHRIYSRLRNEVFTDCVVLCRHCHDLFHDHLPVIPETPNGDRPRLF